MKETDGTHFRQIFEYSKFHIHFYEIPIKESLGNPIHTKNKLPVQSTFDYLSSPAHITVYTHSLFWMSSSSQLISCTSLFLHILMYLFFCPSSYLSLSLCTTHCGIIGVFHSLLEFINLFFGVFSMLIPSLICLFVGSWWNDSFTSILNLTLLPSWAILQCCTSIEFKISE